MVELDGQSWAAIGTVIGDGEKNRASHMLEVNDLRKQVYRLEDENRWLREERDAAVRRELEALRMKWDDTGGDD
jgi:hypothetical protein